jgi:hypothetical protein
MRYECSGVEERKKINMVRTMSQPVEKVRISGEIKHGEGNLRNEKLCKMMQSQDMREV